MRLIPARALLVAVLLVLAGCQGIPGGESPTDTPTAPPTPTASPTASASPTPTTAPISSPPPAHDDYEQTRVRVFSDDGELLGEVGAAVADDPSLRYTGLSETESLPEDRGMLFVYDSPGNHTYVMRNMSFGIDIVYVAPNGTITAIHHAPEPGPDEDGESQGYPGYGQYVLEVNHEWTVEHGVEVGDRVEFDLGDDDEEE